MCEIGQKILFDAISYLYSKTLYMTFGVILVEGKHWSEPLKAAMHLCINSSHFECKEEAQCVLI